MSFASCITDTGGDGRSGSEGVCADGDALAGASGLAFSADGAFAYVAASRASSIAWLTRDPASGALTPAGCIKQVVRAGERCTAATVLAGADAVALAPDGRHVYVAASRSNAVTVFRRDTATGALTQQSCVSESGSDGACTRAPGLVFPTQLAPSADGKDVYVVGEGSLATLGVDPATGDLSPKGCMLADAPAGGACTDAPLLVNPSSAVLASDGRSLLTMADTVTLLSYARDPATGALTQQQCFHPDREDSPRTDACELATWDSAQTVAISADGRGVFIAGFSDVVGYQRDPANGHLATLGCLVSFEGSSGCGTGRDIDEATGLAASADARNLYLVSSENALVAFQTSVAITSAVARRDGTVRVGLACPAARHEGCAGSVTGVARPAHFRLAAGRSGSVRVHLSKRQLRQRAAKLTARMAHLSTSRRVQFQGRAARRSQ